MRTRRLWAAVVLGVIAAAIAVQGGVAADKSARDAARTVSEALRPENVAAVTAKTSDSETLLGLAILSSQGNAEASAAAVKADPANAPVLVLWGWPNEPQTLIDSDGANAIGYYLAAEQSVRKGDVLDATGMLRQGAQCKRIETYDETVVRAVFKAFDALGFGKEERLAAVVEGNFQWRSPWQALMRLGWMFQEGAGKLPEAERDVVADSLLAMAGQVDEAAKKNPAARDARTFVLIAAYRIKMALAQAEKPARARAYQEVITLLERDYRRARGDEDSNAIHQAMYLALSGGRDIKQLTGAYGETSDQAKAKVEEALRAQDEAARRFLDIVLGDVDGVIRKAIVEGLGAEGIAANVSGLADAARVLNEKSGEAQEAMEEAFPAYGSMQRLKQVGLGIGMYQADHEEALPPNLATLVKEGYIKGGTGMITSPMTGRPYVYLGATQEDFNRPGAAIVVYDEGVTPNGYQPALYLDLHVGNTAAEKVKEQAEKGAQ
jgi:hypothetical protein